MQSASPRLRRWRACLTVTAVVVWSAIGVALFQNGGFENGDLSGWTEERFLNPGLSGAQPYGVGSIVRNAGGSDLTRVVGSHGGGPLSLPDATMGAGADLRVPRFGDFAAVINEGGSGRNANVLRQQTTVQPSDIDTLDGKVHVRLAFAPVLEDGAHPAATQAWFFVVVRNKSRGDAILYQSFAYANQPGVPWKVHGLYTYTDWQVADIAPGNASLAVGDVIELEAIAAGCSAGGHSGWVYVDAFGSFIPGPSVVATAPSLVNPGSPLTYTVTARNQGTGPLAAGIVKFTSPAQTTFASITDPGGTCSESGGVVTCAIGTLAVDATYSFQVTVNVVPVASGLIGAGNYSIEGAGEPALLGPVVNTTLTGNPLVDLAMQVDNGVAGAGNGQVLTYTITAQNLSGTQVAGATVTAMPPAALTDVAWTCVASGAGTCNPSGTGAIADTVTLDANGTATYTLTARVAGLSGTLSMPASIAAPGGTIDEDTTNNTTADNDVFVPNTAPAAAADAYVVAEDGILTVDVASGVLANDTDGENDSLTAVLVSAPAHGALTLNQDGGFSYVPAPDYFGADSFSYRANDGSVSSATTTVTIAVTAVNDAPTLAQPANVAMMWTAGPQTVTLSGISAGSGEADALAITATSATPGTVVAGPVTYHGGATATFTVTPVALRQGAVPVTVVVHDGTTAVQRTFTVTVAPPPFYVTHIYPATGPATGGTNVRVFGGGFTLPAPPVAHAARAAAAVSPTVLINGVPAPAVRVESDGVVSAITPTLPAGTPLDVQLILPGGSGTLPLAYTPYARPQQQPPGNPDTPTGPSGPSDPNAPGDPGGPADPGRPGDTDAPAPDPTNPMDPTAPTTDSDGDGITDVWEEYYGTDPHDASDAHQDLDGDGKSNLEEFQANTHPDGRSVRYFAEGNAAAPFQTWVNMYNPSPIEAAINITFYRDDATVVHHLVKAPGGARTTVDTGMIAALRGHAFGMRVDADESVVINRTITWNDRGVGATAERGVDLSTTWYFAEGTTHSGLDTFLLLTNPSDDVATVEVEYLVSAQGVSVMRTHVVPAHSRATVWVNREGAELVDQGFGMVVRASHAVVAERATYITTGGQFEAGETSVGAPTAAQDWYFAEGVSGPAFHTFLLLANPSDAAAEVQVRYLPEAGDEVVRKHVVGPRSRVTIPVNDEYAWAPRTGFGMHVHVVNGVDIVAERAMWWSSDADSGWEEGHGSSGTLAAGTAFAVGDGVAGGPQGASTYLLLANPGATDAQVRITLGFEDGSAPVSADVVVAAGRRVTVDVAALFPAADGKRFSARVESLDAAPILVEQSMYWSFGTGAWMTGVSLPATPLQP